MRSFETLGQWHDHWASLILLAPDRFRDIRSRELLPDQTVALKEGFEQLRSGFHFATKKIGDERLSKVAAELIEMSLLAYLAGDARSGAHMLQECRGLIWSGQSMKPKYVIEAEQRAFGDNILYAGMIPSPFPYEGTKADLGLDQAILLELAMKWTKAYQAKWKDFKYFSWVMNKDGAVLRTSVEPKEDEHVILRPAQRSRGFKRLTELVQREEIRASVLMEIVGPLGDGIVCYDLEECGRPAVSARQLFKRLENGVEYNDLRYHLHEPEIFPFKTL